MNNKTPKSREVYFLSSIRRRQAPSHSLMKRHLTVPILLFIAKGRARLQINEQSWSVEPLQLYYVPAEASIESEVGHDPVDYYFIVFQAITLTKWKGQLRTEPLTQLQILPAAGPVTGGNATELSRRMLHVYEQSKQRETTTNLDWLLHELLLYIDSCRKEQTINESGIEQTISYMEHHFNEKISRDTLAQIAKLTPSSYCRSFKRMTGKSPTDYLNQIRIRHAKERLAEGQSIKEVAASVSYDSEFYFSRTFKKVTGVPPTLYIKRNVLKVAVASRFGFQDSLNSFGVQPVAVVDCYKHPGIEQRDYERRLVFQLEELRRAKPDLIVGDFSHSNWYDTFKQIAPTVIIDHSLDWRESYHKLAELLGREQEAQRVIDQVEHRMEESRLTLTSMTAGKTVAVMQIMSDHIMLQGTVNHPLNELLYRELGLQPDQAVPTNKMRLLLPSQDVPELKTDHLWIRMYNDHHPEVKQTFDRLRTLPFWNRIPAVRNGNIHFIANWFVMSWTPQGRMKIAGDVSKMINEATVL